VVLLRSLEKIVLKQSADKLCERRFLARGRESWASAELAVVLLRSFQQIVRKHLRQYVVKLCFSQEVERVVL
jgi:hypothetical protein